MLYYNVAPNNRKESYDLKYQCLPSKPCCQFVNLYNKQYVILPNNLQDFGREMCYYCYLNVQKMHSIMHFYLPKDP